LSIQNLKIDIKNIAFYNIPDWFSNIGEIMICREAEWIRFQVFSSVNIFEILSFLIKQTKKSKIHSVANHHHINFQRGYGKAIYWEPPAFSVDATVNVSSHTKKPYYVVWYIFMRIT